LSKRIHTCRTFTGFFPPLLLLLLFLLPELFYWLLPLLLLLMTSVAMTPPRDLVPVSIRNS